MSKRDQQFVTGIAIAEFDITVGNTLSMKYPADLKVKGFDDEFLANICLPDGAHIHKEDWTYMILETEDKPGEKYFLYGIGFFRNVRDPTVPRGAIQKSLFIVSPQPYFSVLEPLARVTITRFMDHDDKGALKVLFDTLNKNVTKSMSVSLWGEDFPLNIPAVGEDRFGGASIVELIKMFKEHTMIIWYALLLEWRILFVGQPAHAVGNVCLAAPLLVAPLVGFTGYITPYVALQDISPMQRKPYICGTTNSIFEMKTDFWEVMGSLTTGACVHQSGIKVSAADQNHIRNVISGINDHKGEQWVREQFRLYTLKFLSDLEGSRLKGQQKQHLSNFKSSKLYTRYCTIRTQDKVVDEKTAIDYVKLLEKPDNVSVLEKTKMFYELDKGLENLTAVDEVCDANGVSIVAQSLSETSAQVRKYTASILAQLAISVKGQMAILDGAILDRVIEMLEDPMQNVSSAAAQCLVKISTLYIGVITLLSKDMTDRLGNICLSDNPNLVLKKRAAQTLLNIYRMCPDAKALDHEKFVSELQSPDKQYSMVLALLFDLWGVPLPALPAMSPQLLQNLTALQDDEITTRVNATNFLLSTLNSQPEQIMILVENRGIELISLNEQIRGPSHKLARLSMAVLALVADSKCAQEKIIKLRIIDRVVKVCIKADHPLYLYQVCRFCEVLAQTKRTAEMLISLEVVPELISVIVKSISLPYINTICLPALGALKYLVIYNQKVIASLTNLKQFSKPQSAWTNEDPTCDPAVQEMLAQVLSTKRLPAPPQLPVPIPK